LTKRGNLEVGLRSDEDRKLSRIYRWKSIIYDEEHLPIAWAERNAYFYGKFKGISHLQTHLAFVFGRKRPCIYKVVSDSSYGSKPNENRRLLSQEEEIAIMEHDVKVSHKRGHCDNTAEVTAWINEELLEDERMVSASFIKSTKLLMEKSAEKSLESLSQSVSR
jgi:hypothetical protein